MRNTLLTAMLMLIGMSVVNAQSDSAALQAKVKALITLDSTIQYKTGKLSLDHAIELNVPSGFKFIEGKDADKIIHDLWGNPRTDTILGMLVKDDFSLLEGDHWSFILTYDDDGFVKDEDASKMDYKEMMADIKKNEPEVNEQRKKEGYDAIYCLGWSADPFYDSKAHVLHWARSLKFGTQEDTTLNYDVRLLGRKGVLSMNAVADISQLNEIKTYIPQVLTVAHFQNGSRYEDFDDKFDKVAAYTVGGLIAGKLAAKAGLFVILAKYFKLILLAVAGGFAAARKKIAGLFKKKGGDDMASMPQAQEPEQDQPVA